MKFGPRFGAGFSFGLIVPRMSLSQSRCTFLRAML
jgi:hypothetical protein